MLDNLDHIAIAVKDIDEKLKVFGAVLGFQHEKTEDVPSEKVKVAYLGFDNGRMELVQPTSDDSPISKFLEKRGEGIHHLCFRVDDIEEAIAGLKEKGLQFIEPAPRKGSEKAKVAFLHPKSTGGILLEIKQVLTGDSPSPDEVIPG